MLKKMSEVFERKFPAARADATRIVYRTCGGETSMQIFEYKGEKWWRMRAPGQPDRWFRLYNQTALKMLIDHYGFMDGSGCVNKNNGTVQNSGMHGVREINTLDGLSDEQRRVTGVPQRVRNSGLCWYCAMCFVLFFCAQMRDMVVSKAPTALKRLCEQVLVDKQRAEALRKHLYDVYALGDRPGQPPEEDGQNGFTQMSILIANLGIPMIRLFAPSMYELTDPVVNQRGEKVQLRTDPRPEETCLLAVRCFRTKWRPKRRFVYNGRRYKLISMLIGSEHCGHQIAASTCDMRICRWALSDSDMSQHGIGPIFWSISQEPRETRDAFKKRWVRMWDTMIPVTIFGRNQMCDLNPVNRATHELEKYARTLNENSAPGVVNTDYIYMSVPGRATATAHMPPRKPRASM